MSSSIDAPNDDDDDTWFTSAIKEDHIFEIEETDFATEAMPHIHPTDNQSSLAICPGDLPPIDASVMARDPPTRVGIIPGPALLPQSPSPSLHDTDGEYEIEEEGAETFARPVNVELPESSTDQSNPEADEDEADEDEDGGDEEEDNEDTEDTEETEDNEDTTSESGHSEPWSMEDDDEDDADHDDETKESFKQRLIYWIAQMMFVSGETAEPSPETTWMIEEIVREQVLEMLQQATILANRRGSRSISIVDLIFQIRHDRAKVSRLKTFLSWKDVRKNVKDSDDKGGGDAGDVGDFDEASGGVNPSAPQKSTGTKKAKLILPWEVQSFYSEQVPERDDEEDEEEEEQNEATLARLASADERTKDMTREEYVYWSDCRQASFTFRKGKRFREWAGFGTIIDSKPNDDVVDILGFLTFEIVQTLTEEALKVKAAEDVANKKASALGGAAAGGRNDQEASKKRKREVCSLFEMPEEGRTPVEPKHVREGFRRLQVIPPKYKFMRPGFAGMRTPLRLI